MLRRLRAALLTVLFALLGAAAGRVAAELWRRQQLGEPLEVEWEHVAPRPQEVVPGLVAALRARDWPWSFLHVPPWLAAFSASFVFAVIGRELQPFGGDRMGGGGSFSDGQPASPAPLGPTVETVSIEEQPGAGPAEETATGERPAEGFVPFDE